MHKTSPSTSLYLKPGRLSDVLALIQVQAYHKFAKRSNDGMLTDLRRAPLAADTWIEIGHQHPELFRILEGERHPSNKATVTLIARFVQEPIAPSAPSELPKSPPLNPAQTAKLMDLAIQLHDREVQRRDRWKSVIIPMAVAGGAAGAAGGAAGGGAAGASSPS